MPSVADLALGHQSRRIALSDRASTQALRLFRRADVGNLDASWSVLAPLLVDTVAEAQVTAATASAGFVRSVAREQGVAQGFDTVVPEAFSNVVATGDDLGPALFTGVTTTKSLIGRGVAPARAFEIGAGELGWLYVLRACDQPGRVFPLRHPRWHRLVSDGVQASPGL
jgi:hypothetical protein